MLSLYPSQCFKKIERQLGGRGLTEDLILSPEEHEQKRGSWENSTQKNRRKVNNYLGILKSSNMKKRSWVGDMQLYSQYLGNRGRKTSSLGPACAIE